jgi:hypothetical protein
MRTSGRTVRSLCLDVTAAHLSTRSSNLDGRTVRLDARSWFLTGATAFLDASRPLRNDSPGSYDERPSPREGRTARRDPGLPPSLDQQDVG